MMKFFVLVLLIALSGCATNTDVSKGMLMPNEIAIQVFARNGLYSWIQRPYLKKLALCGGEVISIEISQIDRAHYNKGTGTLRLMQGLFCPGILDVKVSESGARDLVDAARSLGANIEQLTVNP